MPYGIKRQLEIDAERKRRREEKARLKAEKERLKKEAKKKERKRKLKKKANARYYAKVVKARDEQRKAIGEESGKFTIYIVKNGVKYKNVAYKFFKIEATQLFYQLVEENHAQVKFPRTQSNWHHKLVDVKYEIILVKYIDPEMEDKVTLIRNKEGKFIENDTDSPTHKILLKEDWYIEETFGVYGFDNLTDRKTFDFILNDIVLKKHEDYNRIIVYTDKVISHYGKDLDIVTCKSVQQAIDLYDMLEKYVSPKDNPHVLFMGKTFYTSAQWVIDDLEEKTGWKRKKTRLFFTKK